MASTHSSREKGEKNMFIFSRNRNPVQKAVKAILVDVRTGKTHVRLGWSERFGPARSLEISFGDFAEPKRIQRLLGEMAFPFPNGKSEIEFIKELKVVANAYRAEGKRVYFVTDEVGCDAEFSCFVLPTETLGDESGPVFSTPGLEHVVKVAKAGDLDGWQRRVAVPALASSRFVLAISAALAAPVLRLMEDAPPAFGLNFSGESSTGKSTALRLAQSVFGCDVLQSLAGSRAAFQQMARGHNCMPLILDEQKSLPVGTRAKQLEEFTYFLATGRSAAVDRNYLSAIGDRLGTWSLIFLTSSEGGIHGNRYKGEHTRLMDIPAPEGGWGLIDNLSVIATTKSNRPLNNLTAAEFVKKLGRSVNVHHGHALPALVTFVLRDVSFARRKLAAYRRSFMKRNTDSKLSALEVRMLDQFAVIYAGGRLAINAKILPWTREDLFIAVERCWQAAVQQVPNVERDARNYAIKIQRWITQDANIKCVKTIHIGDFKYHDGVLYTPGGKLRSLYLIARDTFEREFTDGEKRVDGLRWMRKQEILVADKNRHDVFTKQVKFDDGRRPRFYCFDRDRLEEIRTVEEI